MNIKRLIKRAIHSIGIEVSRYSPPAPVQVVIPSPPEANNEALSPLPWEAGIWRWPAINPLSLAVSDALLKYIRAGKDTSDFTVVQIGAFDGSSCDPIRKYILEYSTKALFVEPQPDIFEKLVESYKGTSHVSFENAAISDHDGESVLHRFKKLVDTHYIAGALASLSRDTLVQNHHQMEGEVEEVPIKLLTFDTLMRKHEIRSIDLLQIDTEGHDWSIIRSIDFNKVAPSIIHYEISILSKRDQNDSIEYLATNGYRILWYGTADLLAYRQSKDDAPILVNWTEKQ